jgi:hypothetical protein
MNTIHKGIIILAAALILAGLLALNPADSFASVCVEWHVVRDGESLDTISRDYGISRSDLVALNKLSNPQRVYEGQRLCVETGADTPSGYYHQPPGVPPSARYIPASKHYSPDYRHDTRYYHDYDPYCDDWYADDECYPYKTANKYGYQYSHKDYEYDYPSDCACYKGYDEYWKNDNWNDCGCKGWDEYGYYKGYHQKYYSDDAIRDWNFSVIRVREDRDVTIQANSFPHNATFQVEMRYDGGKWVYSDQLNDGGSFKATVPIPHQLRGYSPLTIRVTKYPDAVTDLETFPNYSFNESTFRYREYIKFKYPPRVKHEGIPTIEIENVRSGESVTLRAVNFPPHLEFNVYMGKMGSKGKGGYFAGDFYSGPGGDFLVTVDIPYQLRNQARIAVRTESTEKGYYSYNWFDNETIY